MRLPLSVILYSVKEGLSEVPEEAEKTFFYGRPSFYREETPAEGLILYEGTGRVPVERADARSVWLCGWGSVGAFAGERLPGRCSVFLLKEGYSMGWACNCLHQLFDRWEQWERETQQMVIRRAPLGEYLEAASRLSGKPLSVMNREYRLVALSSGWNELEKAGLEVRAVGERLPVEVVNVFKTDPLYLQVAERREPFLYPSNVALPVQVLCTNLFYGDIYCARVVMFEYGEEIHPWDFYLMEKLTEYLELVYMAGDELPREVRKAGDFLQRLLDGESLKRSELLELYALEGWKAEDQYQLVVLQVSDQDIANRTLEYFRYELMKEFPYCLTAEREERIVMVLNLARASAAPGSFRQDFALFIREGNFRAGYSNLFHGLEQLEVYYRQAGIALRYGSRNNEMIWQHFFDHHALDYFLDKGSEEIPPEQMCASELQVLLEYDRRNHTELYRTLRVYLENRQNAVKTAKDLYIQRGTLLYRLARIQKLTRLDFEKYERLLYVGLSYLMADREKDRR